MEGEEVLDPLEISRTPRIIKDAQVEVGNLDVLVCGKCHDAFHYIEQFQEHRDLGKCTGVSIVRDNYKNEPKPQVWAFMLWKNAQFKRTREGETMPTSWILYQRWCKLAVEDKKAWEVAGHNIQSFTKISQARVQEIKSKMQAAVKSKLTKTIVLDPKSNLEDDPLEEGEIRLSQLSNAQRVAVKAQVATNKANSEVDPLADIADSEMDTEEEVEKANDTPKKTILKAVPANDVSIGLKKSDAKKATRTLKNETTEETVVERILSRRFNQKKKYIEYFVKWENLNESENSWEPKYHLEKCKQLLEEFDKVFNRPKIAPKTTAKTVKRVEETKPTEAVEITSGRPQRTSKQKALNQVKAWCGDITDGEEPSAKRKSFSDDDDDDSSDSFEKKIKLEGDTDSSEDEQPSVTIRRVSKASNSSVNGVSKILSESSRVVNVNQKQIPNLTTGVYIMSKTEGIIKLDSNTPSPGNQLLKVGQKIGQTNIKVIKKDPSTPQSKITKTTPKPGPKFSKSADMKPSPAASMPKAVTVSPLHRRPLAPLLPKPAVRILDAAAAEKLDFDLQKSKVMEDDSDGLEELDFPTDLPLPEPESPPGEFTLCPLTGKILGPGGVVVEEEDLPMENTSLDILVKQAVAELPDADLDQIGPSAGDESDHNTVVAISESAPVSAKALVTPNAALINSTGAALVSSSLALVTPIITTPIVLSTTASTASSTTTSVASSGVATITPLSTKPGGQSFGTIKSIRTSEDVEEALTPTTINKGNPTEALSLPAKKSKLASETPSLLNAALTTKVNPSPARMAPPKKLLSTTPNTVRQKVTTTVNRPPVSRPTMNQPSPTTTIIHKISPGGRNRLPAPKPKVQQEPVLRRASNVTTYKPASVTRRIGNTTIYKTPAKQPPSLVKRPATPIITTTITSVTKPPAAGQSGSAGGVINMPLLTTEDESPVGAVVVAVPENVEEPQVAPSTETESVPADLSELTSFNLQETDTPIMLTGDDGTIYQVAGQNEDGQTILISEGPDGQQQCVLVSSDGSGEDGQTLVMDTGSEEQNLGVGLSDDADGENGEESQVVAQIIKADPPSPGGTRKVVLMLPDGNLMMTDVTAEQYAALELDK